MMKTRHTEIWTALQVGLIETKCKLLQVKCQIIGLRKAGHTYRIGNCILKSMISDKDSGGHNNQASEDELPVQCCAKKGFVRGTDREVLSELRAVTSPLHSTSAKSIMSSCVQSCYPHFKRTLCNWKGSQKLFKSWRKCFARRELKSSICLIKKRFERWLDYSK